MKLGIMQPYFFPYLGYFDLIHSVDRWVVFDTAQYIRHGWVNRNRILHPSRGWQYVIVPVKKHSRGTAIKDVEIADARGWRERITGQLQHYRRRTPHFEAVISLLRESLDTPADALARLNVAILARVCAFLDIPFAPQYHSEMNLPLGRVERPGDWALRISEALGAREYVNPPGGMELFDPRKFAASGIRLRIQRPVEFTYGCDGYRFEPGLSILDVLLWNSREEVKQFLSERRRAERRAGD